MARIPQEHIGEAVLQAKWFVDCGREDDDKRPAKKMMDWEQDEAILFPAVNKVAGIETRAVPYLHWWTFAGYFMEIEEGTFSTVLGIRQKRPRENGWKNGKRNFTEIIKSCGSEDPVYGRRTERD